MVFGWYLNIGNRNPPPTLFNLASRLKLIKLIRNRGTIAQRWQANALGSSKI